MEQNTVEITDKDLMTYLLCRGFKIVRVKKDKTKSRSIVYFKDTPKLNNALLDYTNRDGVINIVDYLAAQKRINNLLYFNKSKIM